MWRLVQWKPSTRLHFSVLLRRQRGRSLSTTNNNQQDTTPSIPEAVQAIRSLLDQHIVGHQDTKDCILLGLAAHEHVFLQGEPGTAKTYAAELAAQAAGLTTYAVQFHRDTRLQDLIGDSIIVRERIADKGEVVRQSVERGGLLTAQVAVLDDLTRAPGEALNVLLRILNERSFQEQPLPLKCAIATANAPRDDMYVEPLDPANLDRFALQVKSDGLILASHWQAVRQVVDMYPQFDDNTGTVSHPTHVAKAIASMDIRSVQIPPDVRECYVLFLQWLSQHPAVTPRNSLLTDRTFLVKAPRILRAQAALEGRTQVRVQDLVALRHMTTFRVPTAVHEQVCQLLQLLAETTEEDGENHHDDDEPGNQTDANKNRLAGYLQSIIQQQFGESGHRIGGPRGGTNAPSGESKMNMKEEEQEGDEQGNDHSNGTSKSKPKNKKDEPDSDAIDHDLLADIGGTSVLHATVSSFVTTSKELKERTARPLRRLYKAFQGPHQIKLNLHASAVSGAESVMAVVHGRSRRSRTPSNMPQSPNSIVGQPRQRGRLQSMGDLNLFQDGDSADISSWLSTPTSSLPRGLLRHPKKRGGTIALARDISDSMWGPRAALASATTQAAIRLAKQRGMRFGYCEFAGTPKFYNQRDHASVRHLPSDNDEGSLTHRSSTPLTDVFLEWGTEMTSQLGNLLGLEQPRPVNPSSSEGHFFGMDYAFCERLARKLDTDGFTNLQEMLRQLLERFSVSGLPPHERHLLIITDGSPTAGSATCIDESMLARTLGVSIHPIFVIDDNTPSDRQEGSYPDVLKFLAEETNGVRFIAKHEVTVDERAELEDREHAHLVQVKVELA